MALWSTGLWNPDLWTTGLWEVDISTPGGGNSMLLSKNKRAKKMATNISFTAIAPVTTGASITTQTFTNEWGAGAEIYINVSAIGTATLQVTVQGIDKLSGAVYTVLQSAAISGNGLTRLQIFPGATTTANLSVNDLMPFIWKITAAPGGTGNVTYSIGVVIFG